MNVAAAGKEHLVGMVLPEWNERLAPDLDADQSSKLKWALAPSYVNWREDVVDVNVERVMSRNPEMQTITTLTGVPALNFGLPPRETDEVFRYSRGVLSADVELLLAESQRREDRTVDTSSRFVRVVALRDIPEHNVSKGDLGGYIETALLAVVPPDKLFSDKGACWLGDDAYLVSLEHPEVHPTPSGSVERHPAGRNSMPFSRERHRGHKWLRYTKSFRDSGEKANRTLYCPTSLTGDALLAGDGTPDARVVCAGKVDKQARVIGSSVLIGSGAVVTDEASVEGSAIIHGQAHISGSARVGGKAVVYGNARISGHAHVFGNAVVCDDARVAGHADIDGDSQVMHNARVTGNAVVSTENARRCTAASSNVLPRPENYDSTGLTASRGKQHDTPHDVSGTHIGGNAVVCGDAAITGGLVGERAVVSGQAHVSREAVCVGTFHATGAAEITDQAVCSGGIAEGVVDGDARFTDGYLPAGATHGDYDADDHYDLEDVERCASPEDDLFVPDVDAMAALLREQPVSVDERRSAGGSLVCGAPTGKKQATRCRNPVNVDSDACASGHKPLYLPKRYSAMLSC